MLRVDNWLDVAPLKNMEEDHSFLFLKKNLMKIFFFFWKTWIFQRNWKLWKKIFFFFFFLSLFFFLKNLEILNFFKEFENFDWWFFFFFFFGSNLRSTSPMPLVPRHFLKISSFFFFWKIYKELIFFFIEIWRFVHYQKVKKMKMKME